ncbi:MAG: sodium-dependent transporter [SAR202 cluster bacterium]|nr:sodium-dependent transporter [SAR202 cluster bacterium]
MAVNDSAPQTTNKPQFSSRLGFLLATIGSAVGIGNIWRFPFVVGSNGGGAFLIPYLIVVALFAFPLFALELSVGRASGRGVVGAFASLGRRWRNAGLLIVVVIGLVLSYYLVVTGWAFGYLVQGLGNSHPRFADYTASYNSLWWFLVVAALTVFIVWRGVNKGIEAASKFLMPLMFAIMVALAIYGVFLSGWGEAMSFYLSPRADSLGNPTVWARAIGQAFFSVGVGMGVMITYGAYMAKDTNIPRSSVVIVTADTAVAFLAGLVIFPIVFSFGGEPGTGPQLAFDTLPQVFQQFGTVPGYIVALLFYLGLTAAALTSAVSLLETVVAGVVDRTGLKRVHALGLVSAAVVLAGLPSALSYARPGLSVFDTPVLDGMDTALGTFGLAAGALLTAAVFGWKGKTLVATVLDTGSRFGRLVMLSVQWLVPAAIVGLLIAMGMDLILHRVIPEGG